MKPKRIRTATVFIVHEGKTLLHFNRKMSHWLPVGGKIEDNETPDEAAHREAREEAGVDITLWEPRPLLPLMDGNVRELPPPAHTILIPLPDGTEAVDFIFYARTNIVVFKPYDPDSQMRWYARDELDLIPLRENIRYHALRALDLLS